MKMGVSSFAFAEINSVAGVLAVQTDVGLFSRDRPADYWFYGMVTADEVLYGYVFR